jgi:hypothetical protein
MITNKHASGAVMRVQAICDWTIGIRIIQDYTWANWDQVYNEVQLSVNEAEQLIEELKLAIIEHKRLDAEYDKYQRLEDESKQSNQQ